jgi:hypothetical protein
MNDLQQIEEIIKDHSGEYSAGHLDKDCSKQLLIWHLEDKIEMLEGIWNEMSGEDTRGSQGLIDRKIEQLSQQIEELKK